MQRSPAAATLRSAVDLGLALGSVVFDLQLLGAAVLMVKQQGYSEDERRRMRHPVRMATEVMLVKTRCLVDFLAPVGHDRDDITVYDFQLPAIEFGPDMPAFRNFVNKRAAHLTWKRVRRIAEPAYPAAQTAAFAFDVIAKAHLVVSSVLAGGIRLEDVDHQKRYAESLSQLAPLSSYFPSAATEAGIPDSPRA
jgi:hypothetical protein